MRLVINTEEDMYWRFTKLKLKYKVKNHTELLDILLDIESKV